MSLLARAILASWAVWPGAGWACGGACPMDGGDTLTAAGLAAGLAWVGSKLGLFG